MKIVNREQFLSLPTGTLFSKYSPCVFEDLRIKGDTCGNDFVVQQISDAVDASSSAEFVDLLSFAVEEGRSVNLNFDYAGRDGLFDKDQLFAVWERKDVEQLIDRLQQALREGY